MKEYFFTTLMIRPPEGVDEYKSGIYGCHRRKWEVSIFDLATLQSYHTPNVSYEMISIFLKTHDKSHICSKIGVFKDGEGPVQMVGKGAIEICLSPKGGL